jgi:hypothetical protein
MQMLDPLEANPRQRLVERRRQEPRQLDQCHAEMLGGAARESTSLGFRQRRVRASQVRQRDAAAARKHGVRKVAEPPAEPERQRKRHMAGGRREAAGG